MGGACLRGTDGAPAMVAQVTQVSPRCPRGLAWPQRVEAVWPGGWPRLEWPGRGPELRLVAGVRQVRGRDGLSGHPGGPEPQGTPPLPLSLHIRHRCPRPRARWGHLLKSCLDGTEQSAQSQWVPRLAVLTAETPRALLWQTPHWGPRRPPGPVVLSPSGAAPGDIWQCLETHCSHLGRWHCGICQSPGLPRPGRVPHVRLAGRDALFRADRPFSPQGARGCGEGVCAGSLPQHGR